MGNCFSGSEPDPSIGNYQKTLSNLQSLRAFKKSCQLAQLYHDEFQILIKKKKKRLYKLDLRPNNLNTQSNRKMLHLITCLRNSTTLHLLKVSYNERAQSIFYLSQSLKISKSLSCLSLDFIASKNVNEKLFRSLFLTFRNLKQLSHLSIDFSLCENLTPKTMRSFSHSIESLRYLSILEVKFSLCKMFGDEEVQAFSLSLKNLRLLSTLNLSFEDCRLIREKGVEELFKSLKKLKHLSSIHLNLSHWTQIRPESQITLCLAQGIKGIKNLSTLSLNFNCCFWMDNSSFFDFCYCLKDLEFLTVLQLDFSDCKSLYDEVLAICYTYIKQMKRLKELEINFSRCAQLSPSALKNFLFYLKTLSLEKLVTNKNFKENEETKEFSFSY